MSPWTPPVRTSSSCWDCSGGSPDNVFLRPAGRRAGPTTTGRNGPSRLVVDLPDSPPKTR
ncbi:hypothetical protein [Streptomyces mirabilis]|uniref:hypothetical protein n=1 Tax=Streptomyces mirabilis TaxID=68239 RepID=UPI0036C764CF